MTQQKLEFGDIELSRTVFGERDHHLKLVEEAFEVEILPRGNTLSFRGKKNSCAAAKSFLQELYELANKGHTFSSADIVQFLKVRDSQENIPLEELLSNEIGVSLARDPIRPKSVVQKSYVDSIRASDLIFAWGPAGTGKTYLAMAMAVSALVDKQVDRIILARPAVEAGEKLGFLPGNLAEKVNPYLRPLYDALHDMMDFEKAQRLIDRGIIEVAPLAFMRGRTLNHAFVILDEAQNSTPEQMKMFLTRLGFNSKAVITGDITQVDLPDGKRSGLIHAINLLRSIKEIAFVEFTDRDIVRHPLVQKIILAYDAVEASRRR